ncbi:GNAT family N-acetyltransferase [Halobacillus salinus]|uniref:GNAT family N-acetyltransferase n=1 Tax=Halobacillus salinus TaxID=192814 RepID=A0A4Z0H0R0_9BACI|nr:GNAT family N-acetyltransferase [Halobacillus salinus]TGB03559.1 GNAT family N-acetyltransferase [Halobacillus salinus]
MEAVKPEKYHIIKNRLQRDASFVPVFAYAVLDGSIDGTVYSESEDLETVLVKTTNGLYFIYGDVANDKSNQWLIHQFRKSKTAGKRFTLFTASELWDALLNDYLDEEAKQLKRYSFEYLMESTSPFSLEPPRGYELKPINSTHIEQSAEFDESYYRKYWGSETDFLMKGFGFCMLHNGEVVSEGTSIFCSRDVAEIDIATNDRHRGKGLATVVSEAFIHHCLEQGLVPRWDCDVSNSASIKLAEKVGFAHPSTYSVFI